MGGAARLKGNRFNPKRLKQLHKLGLTTRVIALRMGVAKTTVMWWLGILKLKANREES